jgi:hypothetical protein
MITYDDLLEQNPWWQGGPSPEEAGFPHRTCFKSIQEGWHVHLFRFCLASGGLGKARYYDSSSPIFWQRARTRGISSISRSTVMRLKRRPPRCYLFIDEIQYVDYWQSGLSGLRQWTQGLRVSPENNK